jgi:hypothetical protein
MWGDADIRTVLVCVIGVCQDVRVCVRERSWTSHLHTHARTHTPRERERERETQGETGGGERERESHLETQDIGAEALGLPQFEPYLCIRVQSKSEGGFRRHVVFNVLQGLHDRNMRYMT